MISWREQSQKKLRPGLEALISSPTCWGQGQEQLCSVLVFLTEPNTPPVTPSPYLMALGEIFKRT